MLQDDDIPPEEKEKWSLDRERDADALIDYMKVDRVIGSREGEDGETEYYIKCTNCVCETAMCTNVKQGKGSTMTHALGKRYP